MAMDRITRFMDRMLERSLILMMVLMTLDVLWGVFTRYAINDQASWTEEVARFLLIWIGILGAVYALRKKMHIAIDLLAASLNHRGLRVQTMVINVVILCFTVGVFIIGGGRLIYISFLLQQTSPALGIPIGFVYMIMPLSGVVIIYYQVIDLIKTINT